MTFGHSGFEIPGTVGPIRADFYAAPSPAPTIVMCHGFKGFARWGFFPWLARQFVEAGFSALAFDFSGSGVGEDRESFTEADAFAASTFSGDLRDLDAVIAEAGGRGWLADGLGLFGFSRGGGIAVLHASNDRRITALVTWAAVSTADRWTTDERAEWRRRGFAEIVNSRTGLVLKVSRDLLDDIEANIPGSLDIGAAAHRVTVPWLIVHGDADETVHIHEGRQLQSSSEDRAELAVIPGATHTFGGVHGMSEPTPQLSAAAERTVRFFRANLPR